MSRLSVDEFIKCLERDRIQEYDKWCKEIPPLRFQPDWNVRIVPPHTGAIVRFVVEKDGVRVSVYLDCYDQLGSFGAPYWEIYPYNDDTYRCRMENTDDLLAHIAEALEQGK